MPLAELSLAALIIAIVVSCISEVNVGFVAIAGLTGLFSQQAAIKLKEIAERFFSPAPAGSDTTPQDSQTTLPPPSIASVRPQPTLSTSPQAVTVAGTGFAEPLTLRLTSPARTLTEIEGARLRNVTATSVEVDLTLDVAGDWKLTVTNKDGQRSAPLTMTVK